MKTPEERIEMAFEYGEKQIKAAPLNEVFIEEMLEEFDEAKSIIKEDIMSEGLEGSLFEISLALIIKTVHSVISGDLEMQNAAKEATNDNRSSNPLF